MSWTKDWGPYPEVSGKPLNGLEQGDGVTRLLLFFYYI